jgi:RNA polymerase sigma-70 factor (ECF subfamily)
LPETQHITPESDLVNGLRQKDDAAYSKLYDNYSSSLLGVIHRIIGVESVAEDTLQEVFIKAWKKIDTYDPGKGKLFTWLLNIARNTAIDKLRSKEFKNEVKNQEFDFNVYESDTRLSTTTQTDLIGLKEIIAKLKPPENQRIIDLIYFNGYTQAETAEEMSLPLGTVKTKVRFAINQLRTILN